MKWDWWNFLAIFHYYIVVISDSFLVVKGVGSLAGILLFECFLLSCAAKCDQEKKKKSQSNKPGYCKRGSKKRGYISQN